MFQQEQNNSTVSRRIVSVLIRCSNFFNLWNSMLLSSLDSELKFQDGIVSLHKNRNEMDFA